MLTTAVRRLTAQRDESFVVRLNELEATIEFASSTLGNSRIASDVNRELSLFQEIWNSSAIAKQPSELKVLFLCGPEPMNDLLVLLEEGVIPSNIWAVESDRSIFIQAKEALSQNCPLVRLHQGELSELFEIHPESFDLVYYDACGPIDNKSVLQPLLFLLGGLKLNPLSVLVTNFCEPDEINIASSVDLVTFGLFTRSASKFLGFSGLFRVSSYFPTFLLPAIACGISKYAQLTISKS